MDFLGIDIGTGGSRAVLIDERGALLASKTIEHMPFASPQVGWAEQDPSDWWRAAAAAIRAVLEVDGVKAEHIGAIGVSGQMHGSVFLDAQNQILRPALLWCDQRTEAQCSQITETIGAERLIELVCNPAVTGLTLPKILWLRENEPDVWRRVRKILLPKDYVRFCLSGDFASDVADSSGTLLFDVAERRWSQEMLDAFRLDRAMLPDVFESIAVTGGVSAAAAAATGLVAGTPIVAGAGDNAAGAIGTGTVEPGIASVTIGTSGVVFVVTERPTLDLKGRTHTLCHAIPDRWHMTGVTQGAGLSLNWFRENLGAGDSYGQLIEQAAAVAPGSDGLIWLPYLMGERTPHLDPQARAAFIGLTASHTRAHMVRSVLEGVAFSLRDCLEIFRKLGLPIERVRLGGGGARSPLWRQIQADVYGQPVEVLEAEEGAAFGAAILAGVGTGAWATVEEACSQTTRVREIIKPNPDHAAILDDRYAVFRSLYPAIKSVWV